MKMPPYSPPYGMFDTSTGALYEDRERWRFAQFVGGPLDQEPTDKHCTSWGAPVLCSTPRSTVNYSVDPLQATYEIEHTEYRLFVIPVGNCAVEFYTPRDINESERNVALFRVIMDALGCDRVA